MAEKTNQTNRFSVDHFVSKFLQAGLIQPSNFYVKFTPPKSLSGDFTEVAMLCAATTLPGRRITTSENRPYGYGQQVRRPYDVLYDEIELTFYIDSKNALALSLFDKWLSLLVKTDRLFPVNKQFVGYKSDYVCPELKIYVMNQLVGTENPEDADSSNEQNSMAIIECELVDAYPIQITPVQLDWGGGDEFARLNVIFAYRTTEYRFGQLNLTPNPVDGKYYNAPSPYDTETTVDQEAKDNADFLTSLANFIGSVADTAQKINQFKTNLTILKRADGILNTTSSLLPFLGNNRTATDTINNVNKIISGTRFTKQNLNNIRKFP
jgi:hypothetical protein